jgi:hypothetical protein
LALFDTGAWTAAAELAANWGAIAGRPSWPRIAVAAAPTTRKQISARIVIVLVKKVSIPADVWSFCRELDDN